MLSLPNSTGFGVWQINVFLFITIHSLYLPVFDHGIAYFDIDTTYKCASSGNANVTPILRSNQSNQSFDELGFSSQQCRSLDCDHFHPRDSATNPIHLHTARIAPGTDLATLLCTFAYQLGCLFSIILYFSALQALRSSMPGQMRIAHRTGGALWCPSFVFNLYGHLDGDRKQKNQIGNLHPRSARMDTGQHCANPDDEPASVQLRASAALSDRRTGASAGLVFGQQDAFVERAVPAGLQGALADLHVVCRQADLLDRLLLPELFTRRERPLPGAKHVLSVPGRTDLISSTYVLVKFVPRRIHILVFALFFVSISTFGELLFFKLNYFQNDMKQLLFQARLYAGHQSSPFHLCYSFCCSSLANASTKICTQKSTATR
ncbi:hypothetical protein L1887_48784 [Cichorium endivia]|nr:hypothetical protein L1887_48784 [Cichorium endivia]